MRARRAMTGKPYTSKTGGRKLVGWTPGVEGGKVLVAGVPGPMKGA